MNLWIMPAAAIISAASSLLSAFIYYETLVVSIKSLAVTSQAYEKQLDARFELKYIFPGMEEYFVITNSGTMGVHNVTLRRTPYFVSRDNVLTWRRLEGMSNQVAQLTSAGILRNACDVRNLIGPNREFFIDQLNIHDSSSVEVSHAENNDAIRIAGTLGYAYVVEWQVKYFSGPDDHAARQVFYFWEAAGDTREDLTDIKGGPGVAKRIQSAESDEADDLFPTNGAGSGTRDAEACRS